MTTPARHDLDDIEDLYDDQQDGYYLVIPDEVVQSATEQSHRPRTFEEYEPYKKPDDDSDEDEEDLSDYAESGDKPLSRNAVSLIGGVTASLVAGVIPSLVVAPPASLVSGVAAGVFGGLMGASLANEYYDRRHRD